MKLGLEIYQLWNHSPLFCLVACALILVGCPVPVSTDQQTSHVPTDWRCARVNTSLTRWTTWLIEIAPEPVRDRKQARSDGAVAIDCYTNENMSVLPWFLYSPSWSTKMKQYRGNHVCPLLERLGIMDVQLGSGRDVE
ncbi:hypothetical protein V8F06_000199 [Rhypophila decipiens]